MIDAPAVGDVVYYDTGTVPWTVREVIRLRRGRTLVDIDLGWRGRPRIEDTANLHRISARYRPYYPAAEDR